MNDVDAAALETFLSAHADSSLILRSNIRAVGLGWSGKAYEAQYLAAWNGELVTGLVGHAWNGNVLLQAPREAAALALATISHSRRAVAGLLGPWEQVEEVRSALGLGPEAFRLREKETLMSVALGEVRGDDTGVRLATAADLDTLTTWRASYEREALFNPSPDVAALHSSLVRSLPEGSWFVLDEERAPCAMGVFTARLPDSVQLGSIYTPPALRSRGYARRLVAGMVRASGAARAVLFTKDAAAMRAYRAVGFRDCGSFGLALIA